MATQRGGTQASDFTMIENPTCTPLHEASAHYLIAQPCSHVAAQTLAPHSMLYGVRSRSELALVDGEPVTSVILQSQRRNQTVFQSQSEKLKHKVTISGFNCCNGDAAQARGTRMIHF